MERMDEQILPAVYAFIGVSFHAKPSELGLLTLSRALVQALSSPIGGLAGDEQSAILGLPSSSLPGIVSISLAGTKHLQLAPHLAKQLRACSFKSMHQEVPPHEQGFVQVKAACKMIRGAIGMHIHQ